MAGVLIVDDEELSRFAVRKLLSRLFPEVRVVGEAENGRIAVELALSLRPDLVLMDIRIPAMNGIEAAQAIRAALPDTRIIVLTAYDSFGFAQRAINIGVCGYLLKPVTEEDFAAVFGAALAGPKPGFAGAGSGLGPPTAQTDDPAAAPGGAGRPPYPFEEETALFKALARGEGGAQAAAAMMGALRAGGDAHFAERCLEFLSSLKRELRALGFPPESIEAADFPPGSAIVACADALCIETSLSRGLAAVLKAQEAAGGAGKRASIQRAIASLPLPELGLERVAECLGMNPQHLSRLFKELFGKRFVEHATALRIEAAKAALADAEVTVEELCRALGWTDSAHFTKVFKENTGLTPKAYARRLAGNRS